MNQVILQAFEWYLESDQNLWTTLTAQAQQLKVAGIDALWLPPAYKGSSGTSDTGYGVYDNYDLGEFDQKGTVRTKYGTKDEYLMLIQALHAEGILVYADVVLNHKMGADNTDTVMVFQVDDGDRMTLLTPDPFEIEAWTRFDFNGRQQTYSSFQWNKEHFTGTDYDNRTQRKGIFLFEGKKWDGDVDREHVNYDYLMGADIDYTHPQVLEETLNWGRWYITTTQVDGLRLDALKHIQFGFFKKWIAALREQQNLFVVGEYWSDDLRALHNYLNEESYSMSLFDVPLHYNLYRASSSDGNFDLSSIFDGTLVLNNPDYAVTFVDNHDTQPSQSLQSWVEEWFKPAAYALILLRHEGTPCIFYGDYYGIVHDQINPVRELDTLISIRKAKLFGQRYDYLDDPDLIGWTYTGDFEHPGSGFAVILSDKKQGEKRMFVGSENAHSIYRDSMGNINEPVLIDDDGIGIFKVLGGSLSVYEKTEN